MKYEACPHNAFSPSEWIGVRSFSLPWYAIDPYPEFFYKRRRIPLAALGWTRKQWKRSRMWKKAGVTEEKIGRLLRNLDHDFLQEMKDGATAEALVEKMFGKAGD